MVVPVALLIARSRSSGQSWAAKRRAAVIGWLRIVRGAYSARADVSLRTERFRVLPVRLRLARGGVDGPGGRHVPLVGIRREDALQQPHRGDPVDQRVVEL